MSPHPDRTHQKDLYRRVEALWRAAADGGGEVDGRIDRLLASFVAELGHPLGVRGAWCAREHREAFVVAGRDAPLATGEVVAVLGDEPAALVPPGDLAGTAPLVLALLGEDEGERRLVGLELAPDAALGGEARGELLTSAAVLRSILAGEVLAARFGDTLREAALIQRSLLPAAPPAFAGYDLAARSVAAHDVGGDLFDFVPLAGGLLALAVGDASGHGLPAALMARDVVVGLRMGLEADLKTGSVLRRLNAVVHQSALASRFVSLLLAELEDNGSLFYFNAGHEPPLLFDAAGRAEELARGEVVLGPLPDVRFQRRFAHVDRGATLLLFTDGLLERRGADGELFGRERLEAAARAELARGAQAVVDGVFAAAEGFGGGARWEDDATLVVVRRGA